LCLDGSAQAAQQVGADRVEQVVPAEIEAVHDGEGGGRALDLGHRDRAVERDHRARRDGQQLVVQRQDLIPVGGGRDGRVAVHGADRGLDLVRARLAAAQALPDQGLTLGDQRVVPARPVLLAEQHQGAVRGRPGRPP
jgi:hypothetical protein